MDTPKLLLPAIVGSVCGALLAPEVAAPQLFTEYANVQTFVPNTDKFGDPTPGGANSGGEAVAVFDVNGDGLQDIVLVTGDPYYHVVLNSRDASGVHTFTPLPAVYIGVIGDAKKNVAKGLGLHDLNGDGLLDLYLCNTGKGGLRLRTPRPPFDLSPSNIIDSGLYRDAAFRTHINLGDGTFRHHELNVDGDGSSRAAVFADFDGDGYVDALTSNAPYFGIWWGGSAAPNQLRRGLADGSFGADVIDAAVVNDPGDLWKDSLGRGNKDFKGIIVRDFDRDDKPDVILGAFSDIWDNVAVPPIWVMDPAGALVDADADGVPDGGYQGDWERGILVLRNVSTPGSIRFEDVSDTAIDNALGLTDQMHTYVTVPADIDRDGDLDLLAAGPRYFFAHNSLSLNTDRLRIYRNDSSPGSIRFTNVTAGSGVEFMNDDSAVSAFTGGTYPVVIPGVMLDGGDFVMTPLLSAAAAPDIDNDGDVDWVAIDRQLFSRNPFTNEEFSHWVFVNDGTGRFTALQPEEHGLQHTGRDLSYGDLNGDGRLDLVSVNGSGGGQTVDDNNFVFFNNVENDNHYVFINVSTPDNLLGIGTKVTVYEAGTSNILGYDEVATDFGYRSKRSTTLHFGLGQVDQVDVRLELTDGTVIRREGLRADRTHTFPVPTAQLLAGKKLMIKNKIPDDAEKNKGVWVVKDGTIFAGVLGTVDDPRCNGGAAGTVKATLRFFSDSSGQDTGAIGLPCENWEVSGSPARPQGYKYEDKELDDGPCRKVQVLPGRQAKAVCLGKGAATDFEYDLTEGTDEGVIGGVLTIGTLQFCSAFDAFKGEDGSDGRKFLGENVPALDSCPEPPSPSDAFLEVAGDLLG